MLMSLKRLMRVGLLLAGAGLIAYGVHYYQLMHEDSLPDLPLEDVADNRVAGEVQYIKGAPSVSVVDGGQFIALKQQDKFYLGSVFKVPGGAHAQIKTNGNYMIAMNGDGEFIFKEARASAERKTHTVSWHVKRGSFRVKPHDWDPGEHLMEIHTARARVIAANTELGLRVDDTGAGQIWVIKGKAKIIWHDGKKRELNEKGMDYL